jgi:hypothetical protein
VSAAARFGLAQTGNVNGRLSLLHVRHERCSDRFDIGANIRWERPPTHKETRPAATGELKFVDAFGRLRCDRPFAAWADGDIDFGVLRQSTAADRSDFRTSGLTLGADTRLRDGATVGAAIGYGRNDADVNAEGSEGRALGRSLILYATFEPSKVVDTTRPSVSVSCRLTSAAGGRPTPRCCRPPRWLAVVRVAAFSADLVAPNVRVAPYARYDYVRSQLDAYGERGRRGSGACYGQMAARRTRWRWASTPVSR